MNWLQARFKTTETAELAARGAEKLQGAIEGITPEFFTRLKEALLSHRLSALADAVDGVQPYVEVLGEAIPPIKAVLSIAKWLTDVTDPRELGVLAFSVAYQASLAQATKRFPVENNRARARTIEWKAVLRPPLGRDTFRDFQLESCSGHPLMRDADDRLVEACSAAGWDDGPIRALLETVHTLFVEELVKTITDGKTKEKFEPLVRYLDLRASSFQSKTQEPRLVFRVAHPAEAKFVLPQKRDMDAHVKYLVESKMAEFGLPSLDWIKGVIEGIQRDDSPFGGPSPRNNIEQYALDLWKWLRFSSMMILRGAMEEESKARSFSLQFAISNEGTRPAEGVHVEVTLTTVAIELNRSGGGYDLNAPPNMPASLKLTRPDLAVVSCQPVDWYSKMTLDAPPWEIRNFELHQNSGTRMYWGFVRKLDHHTSILSRTINLTLGEHPVEDVVIDYRIRAENQAALGEGRDVVRVTDSP